MTGVNKSHQIFKIGPVPDLEGALCAEPGMDPETWYLDDTTLQGVALGYCKLCPVSERCLERALEEERKSGYMAFGVRGGRTASQRQRRLDLDKYSEQYRLKRLKEEAEDAREL